MNREEKKILELARQYGAAKLLGVVLDRDGHTVLVSDKDQSASEMMILLEIACLELVRNDAIHGVFSKLEEDNDV